MLAVGLVAAINLEVPEKAKPFLGYHMLGAFTSAAIFIAVMLIGRFGKGQAMSLLRSLLLAAGLLGVLGTGYLGGELVHRHGLPQAALENTSR